MDQLSGLMLFSFITDRDHQDCRAAPRCASVGMIGCFYECTPLLLKDEARIILNGHPIVEVPFSKGACIKGGQDLWMHGVGL